MTAPRIIAPGATNAVARRTTLRKAFLAPWHPLVGQCWLYSLADDPVIDRLRDVLAQSSDVLNAGAIIVVEDAQHRVRRMPFEAVGAEALAFSMGDVDREHPRVL